MIDSHEVVPDEGARAESPAKLLEELELASEPAEMEEFDPESIVEAAEALLREGAPHDFEILVIGSGPGGHATALRAAEMGARVGLVEASVLGGTAVNRGGVPAAALLESAAVKRAVRRAAEFGVEVGDASANLEVAQNRKAAIVARLREQALEALENAGVQLIRGRARFVEEHTVEIEDGGSRSRVKAVHIVIAAGGVTRRPGIPGIDLPGVLTTDEALELKALPSKIIILGAAVLAVEFATIFAELGTDCTILHGAERLLPKEDRAVSAEVRRALEGSGVRLELGATIESVEEAGLGLRVNYEKAGSHRQMEAQFVLIAGGRRPNIEELGLDIAGIRTNEGKIVVDEDFGTSVSGVYAIGDCIRSLGWAHQAAAEGRRVAEQIMGDPAGRETIFTPHLYRTFPEAATIGLTLDEANAAGLEAASSRFSMAEGARAMAGGQPDGFVNLVFEIASEKILGCQIVGPGAGELIQLVAQALRAKWTLQELVSGVHAYPTYGEGLALAAQAARRGWAGEW